MNNEPAARKDYLFERALVTGLALLVLSAAGLPRLCAFMPSILGSLAVLAGGIFLHRRPRLPPLFGPWVCGFALLALVSSLWAPMGLGDAAARAVRAALALLPGLFLITSIRQGVPAAAARLIVLLYVAAAAFLSVEMAAGLPLYHLANHIPFEQHKRLDFLNRNVVVLALLAAPVLALALSVGGPRNLSPHAMAGIVVAAMAVVLLGTTSQSAQLAVLVMFLFATIFPYGMKSAWIALGALIAGGFLFTPWLAQLMFHQLPPLLKDIPIIGNPHAYAANRLEIWDYVSRYALNSPLYGYGIEATRAIKDFDSAQIYQKGTSILHPHNIALQLWMEFGVIGALAGTAFLLHVLWFLYRQPRRTQRIALPVLMGCLSMGAMSYGLWQGWWLGLLVLTGTLTALAVRLTPAATAINATDAPSSAEEASNRPSPS